MINEENLTKLYDAVLVGEELTTKKLNGYGFNSKDLNDLIQIGSIERVKRGLYSFKNIEELFYYGKKLIAQQDYDKASFCFERCYELDPNHRGSCFQLFLRSIQKRDYERAFSFYDKLLESDNEYYLIDAKLYLYILSFITEIPKRYTKSLESIKLEDILIPSTDKRYNDIPKQNMIRTDIYNRKLLHALKQLNGLTAKNGPSTVQDVILKRLLYQAIYQENVNKKIIYQYISGYQFDEVVKTLEEKQKLHNLGRLDSCILDLTKQIIKIQKDHVVPLCSFQDVNNMFDAINNCNYSRALELSYEFNKENNISNDKSSITRLLEIINSLIKSLTPEDQLDDDEIFNSASFTIDEDVSFSTVISYLLNNEMDKAFDVLETYMKSIGKSEYQFLIIDLIKISLLENDFEFTKPKEALNMLEKDNFSFDVTSSMQDFYIALSQNKYEEARIYLDIISKGNKFCKNAIATDKLYQVLELSSKVSETKSGNSLKSNNENEVINLQNDNSSLGSAYDESLNSNRISSSKVEKRSTYQKSNTSHNDFQERDTDFEFVSKKHDELLNNKGIILIKSLKDDKIDKILDIARQYPDMVASVIGQGKNKQIVLKYKLLTDDFVDIKGLYKKARQALNDKRYDKCIDAYLQVLHFFDEPIASIYAKLGLSYMKMKKKNLAIDYLTVATFLADKDDIEHDYSDLIFRLSSKGFEKSEIKPAVKMDRSDFTYHHANKELGIDNFDKINSYIIDSGLDVENACKQLNMTPEQIDIIKLTYAKEYYAQGYFEKGDLFLKSYEKSQNKTKESLELFREIMKNKKFYQNRDMEQSRKLSLSLKPRK